MTTTSTPPPAAPSPSVDAIEAARLDGFVRGLWWAHDMIESQAAWDRSPEGFYSLLRRLEGQFQRTTMPAEGETAPKASDDEERR